MVRAAESPAVPLARTRPAWWRRGVPQTQTAYVGVAFAATTMRERVRSRSVDCSAMIERSPPRALQNLTLPRRSRKGQSLPN
jgi:hypothetical protein